LGERDTKSPGSKQENQGFLFEAAHNARWRCDGQGGKFAPINNLKAANYFVK
jgi:hypothetical protein